MAPFKSSECIEVTGPDCSRDSCGQPTIERKFACDIKTTTSYFGIISNKLVQPSFCRDGIDGGRGE
jgi:hypothetical protein